MLSSVMALGLYQIQKFKNTGITACGIKITACGIKITACGIKI